MKRTDLPAQLAKILTEVPYVTVASVCPNGEPWNTPVRAYFDENLSLYWASWPKNQHSRNIAHTPHIFAVVYDSTASGDDALGLYMEMTARMLTKTLEIEQARTVYITNFGENLEHGPFIGECPRRLYKATVRKIWYNSDDYIDGNFIDVRRKIMRPTV